MLNYLRYKNKLSFYQKNIIIIIGDTNESKKKKN